MTTHVQAKLSGLLVTMLAAIVVPAFAEVPSGVAPGAVDRIAEIQGICPTFIWDPVPGAAFHELVGYRLPDGIGPADPSAIDLAQAEQVLYAKVPGSAPAWGLELAECLAPSGTYVWFVRAVFREDRGEPLETSEWSHARFFSISAMPTAGEVEEALSVLRRYTGHGHPGAAAIEQPLENEPTVRERPATRQNPTAPLQGEKSLTSAKTAVKGSVSDMTGETYGVVGVSASADGAGLGAANTGGGADLVLDGSADGASDTSLRESGIDRRSPSPETFVIENSQGGGMTVQVDGVDVVTTATDQDTVGALGCTSGELAKWDGANWVCAPDLDTDTDTLGGLACGSGEVAKWSGSSWTCAPDEDTLAALGCADYEIAKKSRSGWECAPDEDTTYSFGPGLAVDDGQVVIDPSAFSLRVTTLDSAGDAGRYSSLAIGTDGLGLISYHHMGTYDLKVAHCDDAACTGAAITTLDDSGLYTSLAIGADGLGLISYYDATNDDLKVAHCNDTACTGATISTLDSGGNVGQYTSLAIGADGLGLISYYDVTNGNLKVAHCTNTTCTGATVNTLASAGDVGQFTSLAIGADGLGLISYHDVTDADLEVAHCNNTACTSAALTTVHSVNEVGRYSSVAIGADGFGLISYFRDTGYDLLVAHCDNAACTSRTITVLDTADDSGSHTSLAVGPDGLGFIAYHDGWTGSLKVARCIDVVCSYAIVRTVQSRAGQSPGQHTSVAFGDDGRALVSCHYHNPLYDLQVVHLPLGF